MKTRTFSLEHLINPLSCTFSLLLIQVTVASFALTPEARAQCPQRCDASMQSTALGGFALPGGGGQADTAIGFQALFSNTIGNFNTALGFNSLFSNTDGMFNTAIGSGTLFSNTFGIGNTAVGDGALGTNTIGSTNIAIGDSALPSNTSGNNNIALGISAGQNLATGSNNIYIGNFGDHAAESGSIHIGTRGTHTHTSIAGIYGVPVAQGAGVVVGPNGHLGTVVSSVRFKEAVKPMDNASEVILGLKPVTFRYKHDLDPQAIPQFGLVAEEVEKVTPDLVARDEQGKPYTVRYDAVNAMLLNEFLKEHKKVEQQRKDFQAALSKQQKQIETLTAGLQKISAQLAVVKSVRRSLANNQ
jgi:hypothetical protein